MHVQLRQSVVTHIMVELNLDVSTVEGVFLLTTFVWLLSLLSVSCTLQSHMQHVKNPSLFCCLTDQVFASCANIFPLSKMVHPLFTGRGGNQIIMPYRGDEYDYRYLRLMGDLGQIMLFVSHMINS